MQRLTEIKNYARTPDVQELPSLIEVQLDSFKWFLEDGLLELFDEINPIESFNHNLKLYFPGKNKVSQELGLKFYFEPPKYTEEIAIERDLSYAAPLYIRVALVNEEAGGQVITSDMFLGDFPIMTDQGTFIINGT